MIHLVQHSDKTLARWASTANIIGLPIAFLALLVGVIALLVQRSASDSGHVGSHGSDYSSHQTTEVSGDDRKADHGSTYIEMTGGSLSIAQPGQQPSNQVNPPNVHSERLLFRAIKITSQGESQEVQIFDAESVDKWINRDPWGSAGAAGETDDE